MLPEKSWGSTLVNTVLKSLVELMFAKNARREKIQLYMTTTKNQNFLELEEVKKLFFFLLKRTNLLYLQ